MGVANKATGDSKLNDSPVNQLLNPCFHIIVKDKHCAKFNRTREGVISSVNWRLMYLFINLGNCPVKFFVYPMLICMELFTCCEDKNSVFKLKLP